MDIIIRERHKDGFQQTPYNNIVYAGPICHSPWCKNFFKEINDCLCLLFYHDNRGECVPLPDRTAIPLDNIVEVRQDDKATTKIDKVVVKQLRTILGDKFIEYKPKTK